MRSAWSSDFGLPMESLKIPCTSFLFNVLELATSNRVGVSYSLLLMCFFINGRVIFILSTPFRPQWFGPTSPSRREVKVQKLEFGPAARAAKILPEAMAKVSPETMVDIGDLHLFETIYGVFNNYV